VHRGDSFRPDYKRVTAIRSVFQCPCLALSATATPFVFGDVKKALHMQDCYVKAYPPDRSNIFIDLAHRSLVPDRDLACLVSGLRAKRHDYPKTLVYGRSINCITELYAWFLGCLKQDAFITVDDSPQCMVAIYHAHLSDEQQQTTMTEFKKTDSTIRVLVSTVEFGIGDDIADIRQVVHWDRLSSLMTMARGRTGMTRWCRCTSRVLLHRFLC